MFAYKASPQLNACILLPSFISDIEVLVNDNIEHHELVMVVESSK